NYVLHLKLKQDARPDRLFDMEVMASRLCGATPKAAGSKDKDKVLVGWDIELRSVEAIYNYLGGIVRAQLKDPELFERAYQFPRDFGPPPFFLFKLYEGPVAGALITANLGSVYYSIAPATEYDQDKSTQVISLLTDLWALES